MGCKCYHVPIPKDIAHGRTFVVICYHYFLFILVKKPPRQKKKKNRDKMRISIAGISMEFSSQTALTTGGIAAQLILKILTRNPLC